MSLPNDLWRADTLLAFVVAIVVFRIWCGADIRHHAAWGFASSFVLIFLVIKHFLLDRG